MAINRWRTEVLVADDQREFELIIYGFTPSEIRTVPTGGQIVRASLKVCRIDPDRCMASLWWVR